MLLIATLLLLQTQPDDPVCDDEDTCREACTSGNVPQCQALADLIVEDDRPAALKLYEQACSKGILRSCSKLAFRLEESNPKADHLRAMKLAEHACTGNDALGCANLAVWLWDEGPATFARAAVIAAKACKLKEPFGCGTLGNMTLEGVGVAKDAAKGKALLEQACEQGADTSCTSLGIALIDGTAGSVDLKRAAKLFDQACTNGYAAGCFQLSGVTRRGLGMRRDRRKAAALLEQACSLGLASACPPEDEDAPEPELVKDAQ